jgi:hypothetical protein
MFGKKPTQIFQDSAPLAQLVQKAQLLSEMNAIVVPLLPVECQPHCRVANFENGTLTLSVAKQQIITPLRFVLPNLIPRLQRYPILAGLENIKTKIMLAEPPRQLTPLTNKPLTANQQKILGRLKTFLSTVVNDKN